MTISKTSFIILFVAWAIAIINYFIKAKKLENVHFFRDGAERDDYKFLIRIILSYFFDLRANSKKKALKILKNDIRLFNEKELQSLYDTIESSIDLSPKGVDKYTEEAIRIIGEELGKRDFNKLS